MSTQSASATLLADGTYSPPNLSLTVSPDEFEDFDLTGTGRRGEHHRLINVSGFQNTAVTLERE